MTAPVRTTTWGQSAAYRYGMLAVIVGLLLAGVWELHAFRDEPRHHPMGIVLALMLLVNHVVESFLPEASKRRVRVPQFLLIGAGFFYIMFVFIQRLVQA